jgi:CRP/FNR family transcriptional regulator, cyclic AMP receptor protein
VGDEIMQVTSAYLQQISIFSKLEVEQLAYLQAHATIQSYLRTEIILHEGDRLPSKLFAVLKGNIQIKKTSTTGKETLLRSLPAGEIFAAPSLFGDGVAPATVVAEQDCDILTVERLALLNLIQQTPEVAFQIIITLTERLQTLHSRMHGVVSERAIVRLAQFIHAAAIADGTDQTEQGLQLRSCLSYYQIARSIGITYEECVRLFKQIQSVVRYHRGGTILVLDPERLHEIAQGQVSTDG